MSNEEMIELVLWLNQQNKRLEEENISLQHQLNHYANTYRAAAEIIYGDHS